MKTERKAHTDGGLTERERAELALALRAKRDEIRGRRLDSEDAAPDEEADPVDIAVGVTSDAEAAGISVHDALLLREIDAALVRMERGTYGVSEDTGEPIPVERLRAVPWARRTAPEEERREVRTR